MKLVSAPAKLILCGEHAVVYGRPAIALPLDGVRAYARTAPLAEGRGLHISAPDLKRSWPVAAELEEPLSDLARTTLAQLGAPEPDLEISLTSEIPIASGMGSGAAIASVLVRALAGSLGCELAPAEVSALVYASEQRFHGTPSGIDNTVIAYQQPIWFQRAMVDGGWWTVDGETGASPSKPTAPHTPIIEPIVIGRPFTLVVGDTGVRSATRLPVGQVRRCWEAEPVRYEALFDAIGTLTTRVRAALAEGVTSRIGPLLNENQVLLEQLGVSSVELNRLVAAAREAGALGAKLSGGGWGGVMLALTDETHAPAVATALREAGAVRVLITSVAASAPGHLL